MDVAGSVALVTGANRGLGAAFCRALLDQGASKVYAGARDPDTIQIAGVIPVRLDITSPAEVAAQPPSAATSPCWSTTPASSPAHRCSPTTRSKAPARARRLHGHRHGSGGRRTEGVTRRRRRTGARGRRGRRVRGPRRRHQPLRHAARSLQLTRCTPPSPRRRRDRHRLPRRTGKDRHRRRCPLLVPRTRPQGRGAAGSSSTSPQTWTTGILGSSTRSLSAIT